MPSQIATDLAQLARLASDGGLDLQQVALRVKTDLLLAAANPAPEDMDAFRTMASALIPVIDEATATILARKLASWPHAPQEVLAALRARGGSVLAALIRHGMPLAPDAIEEIAAEGDDEARLSLAGRPDLGAGASIILAGAGAAEIDLALAGNTALALPRAALDLLLARATRAPGLALALLGRDDLPAAELAPLFLQASLTRRLAMIDAAAAHLSLAPAPRRPPLPADQLSALIATVLVDRAGAFAALADAFGGGPGYAQALADDHTRQLAALTLTGCGVSPEDGTRFLIGIGDDAARSVDRIFALVDLMRRLDPAVARRLAQQIGGASRPAERSGQLQPAMDPSGTPVRAGAERGVRAGMREVLRKLGGKAR